MTSAFDPNRWTVKTREAFQAAAEQATAGGNPEVTPEHLLVALVSQPEGVVLPVLERAGVPALEVRQRATDAVAKLPRAYDGSEPQVSRPLRDAVQAADQAHQDLGDEYLSTEHLLLALAPAIGVSREQLLAAL